MHRSAVVVFAILLSVVAGDPRIGRRLRGIAAAAVCGDDASLDDSLKVLRKAGVESPSDLLKLITKPERSASAARKLPKAAGAAHLRVDLPTDFEENEIFKAALFWRHGDAERKIASRKTLAESDLSDVHVAQLAVLDARFRVEFQYSVENALNALEESSDVRALAFLGIRNEDETLLRRATCDGSAHAAMALIRLIERRDVLNSRKSHSDLHFPTSSSLRTVLEIFPLYRAAASALAREGRYPRSLYSVYRLHAHNDERSVAKEEFELDHESSRFKLNLEHWKSFASEEPAALGELLRFGNRNLGFDPDPVRARHLFRDEPAQLANMALNNELEEVPNETVYEWLNKSSSYSPQSKHSQAFFLYYGGVKGLKINKTEAVRLWKEADLPESHVNLALIRRSENNATAFEEHLTIAAEKGHVGARLDLADLKSAECDFEAAVGWLREILLDFAGGLDWTSLFSTDYAFGAFLQSDFETASEVYETAAKLGVCEAALNSAFFSSTNSGGAKMRHLLRASRCGVSEARRELAMELMATDDVRARWLLKRACDDEDGYACWLLGRAVSDVHEERALYRRAIELDPAGAPAAYLSLLSSYRPWG